MKTSVVLVCLCLAANLSIGQPSFVSPACSQAYVRQNIYSLDTSSLTIRAYRKAIQIMKNKPTTDPTSWRFQANIHGTSDSPSMPEWNQCEHGDMLFFLAWHRMYVYFFERIIRKTSGYNEFALPYWNYTPEDQRQGPFSLRIPGNTTNSLFLPAPQRGNNFVNGGELPGSAVSTTQAMNQTSFLNFSSILNGTPHGVVHMSIGGWMQSVGTAAQDPVFWLHHSNIDRLWNKWIEQGGGRSNPINSAWLNKTYVFFDENGNKIAMSVKDIINTASQLCYRYDDESCPLPLFKFPQKKFGIIPKVLFNQSTLFTGFNTKFIQDTLKSNLRKQFILDGMERNISIKLTNSFADSRLKSINSFEKDIDTFRNSIYLLLENFNIDGQPEGFYEVYVNLPKNVVPNYQNSYYLGNISTFGMMNAEEKQKHSGHNMPGHEAHMAQPKNYVFDVTSLVYQLISIGKWNNESVLVTFVPNGVQAPRDIAPNKNLKPIKQSGRIRFSNVKIQIIGSGR